MTTWTRDFTPRSLWQIDLCGLNLQQKYIQKYSGVSYRSVYVAGVGSPGPVGPPGPPGTGKCCLCQIFSLFGKLLSA